jgi:hypothetical protein
MSTDASNTPASTKLDLAALTFIRPAEIKTYHKSSYARLEPSSTFDGSNKTVLITGGGVYLCYELYCAYADRSKQLVLALPSPSLSP